MELREAVKTSERDSLLSVEPLPIPDFLLDGQPIQVLSAEARHQQDSIPQSPERREPLVVRSECATQASLFDQPGVKEASTPFLAGGETRLTTLADLKPYLELKDSGVPWLGAVPEHWEVLPEPCDLRRGQ